MDLPRTRHIAARLEVVAETGSTNADLRAAATGTGGHPHLSVLVADSQTAGRGRLDRSWVAPAGAAIAVSTLLRRLPAPELRGWIPLAAGVAMANAVAAQLPGREIAVKWPNDVLVDGRKICGILAEAVADDAVIVGAGVNTRMTASELPVPTATSFAVLGAEVDVDRLIADHLRVLDALVTSLATTEDAVSSGLHAAATSRCGTLGLAVRVSLPGDGVLEGRATGLDADGRLLVDAADGTRAISAGDVVHVRPA